MAPPRVENKKFSKEKAKKKPAKKETKSSLPSTAIAVAVTAIIAICVAVYYKNGYKIEQTLDKATMEDTRKSTGTTNSKRSEGNADFKVLPRLDGVKVCESISLTTSFISLRQSIQFQLSWSTCPKYCILINILFTYCLICTY